MLQKIRNTVGFIKAAQDPYTLIQNALAQQNPALVKAYNSIVEHGGDYKAAMNDVATQMGIDKNTILSMIN